MNNINSLLFPNIFEIYGSIEKMVFNIEVSEISVSNNPLLTMRKIHTLLKQLE